MLAKASSLTLVVLISCASFTEAQYFGGYSFPYMNGTGGGGGQMSASSDVVSDASQSMEAMQVLANSANLTALNSRCDVLISENLKNHSSYKDTQPIVPTNINVKFILITLNDIDDVNGIVSLTARIDFRWNDSRLALPDNETCHGESLLIPTTDVWFPYFIIQNGAASVFYPDAWEKFPSSLRDDGHVDWRVAFKFDLACDMDFTIFPFDTQYCKVAIQSPHYHAGELTFQVNDNARGVVVFSADEADHPLWELRGQSVLFSTKVPGIQFWLELKRKWLYFIYTIAIPVFCVCLLTATTFVVPAEGEEKLSTVISALLSFFLLYLLFIGAIPADSTHLPLLMVFFSVQILLTTVMVLVCAIILRLLGIEEAEEEVKAQLAEETEEVDRESAHRIGFKGVGSGKGTKSLAMATSFLYPAVAKSNAVAPILEQDEEFSDDEERSKDKATKSRRCITAHKLNEIVLAVYIVCVAISVVAFVGNMAKVYKSQEPDFVYTQIFEYNIGE